MEKEITTVTIEYPFDWRYGVKISKIREDLDAIEKLGATDIDIELDVDYGSPSMTITARYERLETDEEFKARIDKIKRIEEEARQRDLEILRRLKSKYEK